MKLKWSKAGGVCTAEREGYAFTVWQNDIANDHGRVAKGWRGKIEGHGYSGAIRDTDYLPTTRDNAASRLWHGGAETHHMRHTASPDSYVGQIEGLNKRIVEDIKARMLSAQLSHDAEVMALSKLAMIRTALDRMTQTGGDIQRQIDALDKLTGRGKIDAA